jgi:transposase
MKEVIMTGKGILMMSREELRRVSLIRKVLDGEIRQKEVAEILDLSDRQVRRIVSRVREKGDEGVIHGLRGEPSHRAIEKRIKGKVIGLCRGRYEGFGPTLASEKLKELDGIDVSRETLRGWFREAGFPYRKRRARPHRQWRERKRYFGEMVQMDGSHHDWFEGRAARCVLMGYVDDATGNVYARFYGYEGTIPAMDSLRRYVKRYGLPLSVYLDKHSTYKLTGKTSIEDELRGEETLSEVERALKELGVKVIHADSPQAKGRIERLFRTFQDRLVKEMRLVGVSSMEEGNRFLESYLPIYNKRFRVVAAGEADLHRRVPRGVRLERILCRKTWRFLRNDFTVSHNGKLYQVEERTRAKRVVVEDRLDGSMAIVHKDRSFRYREITKRPERQEKPKPLMLRRVYIPPRDHPLKRRMMIPFRRSVNQNGFGQANGKNNTPQTPK